MAKYTWKELAKEVLRQSQIPLSSSGIWEYAVQNRLHEKKGSFGKTPEMSISSSLYMDIKNNSNSPYFKVGKEPRLFGLKGKHETAEIIEVCQDIPKDNIKKFNERDLHPLLATFVRSNAHFRCYAKTIFHEKSIKRQKGYNEWLHPDIVGVYFPFEEYEDRTLNLIEVFKDNPYRFFSFEMKVEIGFYNLREYFFQALSNSGWAHEGYLVTLRLDKNPEFIDEIRRLNNSFGIGVIQLNIENIEQSEILFAAKTKDSLDWATIDRLVADNSDFDEFIQNLMEDIKLKKVKSAYDKILSENDVAEYVERKGLAL
jgi:hypothetical protein